MRGGQKIKLRFIGTNNNFVHPIHGDPQSSYNSGYKDLKGFHGAYSGIHSMVSPDATA